MLWKTLALKECPTCYTPNVPFTRVLFLQCGHSLCLDCITKCASKCPTCRTRIVPGTPHRIYLSPEELAQADEVPSIKPLSNSLSEKHFTVDQHGFNASIHTCEGTCATIETLRNDVRDFERRLQIADGDRQSAQIEAQEKDDTIQRYKSSYLRKKKEVQELQSAKEADERQIRLLNSKIKALVREKARKKSRNSDTGDVSLQIEDSNLEVRTANAL